MENLLSEVILDSSEDENSDVERCRGPVKRPAEDSEDEETIQKCVSCKQETDTFVHVTCLHFFCSECYKQLFSDPSGQPICPEDGKVIVPNFKAIKSVFAGEQALVPKMKIPCQNEERGCDKMIFFQDMSDHLSHCVFRLFPSCPYGCKDQVVFKDLTVHLDKLCKCRLVKCSFCCDDVPLNVLQKHEKKCPKKPVACPYCKTEGILFKELTDHVESCPMSPSVCVMRQMGCSFEGTKQTADEHQQCWPSHIEVLVKSNISMQRQLNEMSARIDAMERSMGKEPTADVEISAAEPQNPRKDSSALCEDGIFLWPISDISKHIRELEPIISPYFYIKQGYHMCLHLSIKRDITLRVSVVEGEYDANLDWPFAKRMKVTILDQYGDMHHHVEVDPSNQPINLLIVDPTANHKWMGIIEILAGVNSLLGHDSRFKMNDTIQLKFQIID